MIVNIPKPSVNSMAGTVNSKIDYLYSYLDKLSTQLTHIFELVDYSNTTEVGSLAGIKSMALEVEPNGAEPNGVVTINGLNINFGSITIDTDTEETSGLGGYSGSDDITFITPYKDVPLVLTTIKTKAPSVAYASSAFNTTSTGAKIYVSSTASYSLKVFWLAIGV